jgi:hypothetical protein
MSSKNSFNIEVEALSSAESYTKYNDAFLDLGSDNPYYSLELLQSNQEHQELFCFYFYKDGTICALMPFNLRKIIINDADTGYFDVSSPWGYNGPLFSKQTVKEEEMAFWDAIDTWYGKNKVVSEFLRFNFEKNYLEYSGTATHTLKNVKGNVTDFEKVWANLKSNTRNQYRKAEKEGLTFEMHYKSISEEKIAHFYQLYIGTMDRREAIDSFYHSMDYFMDFCANNPNRVAIGLVYQNNIPISCELFLLSEDTMFSFLGGTNAQFFKLRPNEYLKITAMKWAKEFGLHFYMIGGGQSDGDNLYVYKKKYFPYDEDINFFTGRKIVDQDMYKKLVSVNHPNIEALPSNIAEGYFPKYRDI